MAENDLNEVQARQEEAANEAREGEPAEGAGVREAEQEQYDKATAPEVDERTVAPTEEAEAPADADLGDDLDLGNKEEDKENGGNGAQD